VQMKGGGYLEEKGEDVVVGLHAGGVQYQGQGPWHLAHKGESLHHMKGYTPLLVFSVDPWEAEQAPCACQAGLCSNTHRDIWPHRLYLY